MRLDTPEALQRLTGSTYPLSEQQFAAVTAPLEPQVVIAGAGSGKTTVMAARVVWLVATGLVAPHEVLGLTFTTKATHELATRIRGSLRAAGILRPPGERVADRDTEPEEPEEPTVATYNAYAASLLTEHGLRIGHEPDTRVIADASRYQLAARVVARHRGTVELLSDHPKTVIDNLLALDSAMSEHLVTPDDVRAFQDRHRGAVQEALAAETLKTKIAEVAKVLNTFGRREELLGLVESYRATKRDLGLMDFSDQIELGARLADVQREVGALERGKYHVVLLDEYQDTSVAQALMLSRLFSGPDEAAGRGHAVSAVGDPNQAIYGWRGASVSNIVGFGQDFPGADGSADVATYPLSVNRRSDARILQAANDLAAPLYRQFTSVRELRAAAARRGRHGAGRGPPQLGRRARLAAQAGDRCPRGDGDAGLARDRRADPRQRPRRRGVRRAHPGRDPGGDRRPPGPAPPPGGRRGRRHAHAAPRPHRQRRAAHPAHRAAVGGRQPRPGAARPPGAAPHPVHRAARARAAPRPRRGARGRRRRGRPDRGGVPERRPRGPGGG